MPFRQINEFSQKGNRKKIELVARPVCFRDLATSMVERTKLCFTYQNMKIIKYLTFYSFSEELIETLEENQVQLQNMMTSKYIAFFLEEISSWQKRLCMVDQVISLWFDVQRTWSHLESIFIGSEDIRYALLEQLNAPKIACVSSY